MVEIRLSADERRMSILRAALPVFASKGFDGTTTRDIAEAAEVSEALLYQHFPSKENMHEAIQELLCSVKDTVTKKLSELKPSTESLVKIIYMIVHLIMGSSTGEESDAVTRLMIKSLIEDGKFARSFHESRFYLLLDFMRAAVVASKKSGDLVTSPLNSAERMWFTHHLAVLLRLNCLTEVPVFDHKKNLNALKNDAVFFSLRGIGLKDEAIKKYFDLKKLDKFYRQITEGSD